MARISDVTGFMDWMNRNWQQSFAPIQDYSSFLLQLAVQKRQREMQLQDEARRTAERRAEAETERAFTRERDTARELATTTRDLYLNRQREQAEMDRRAYEERMVDVRAASARKEYERQYEFLDAAKKKDMRETELRRARALGVSAEELPDNASIGDIAEEQARSHGRQLIAAAKTVATSLQRYALAKGESIQQITHGAITQAIGNLTDKDLKSAKMTRDELNQLLTTGKFEELRAKALREKNNAKYDLLNRIDAESTAIIKTGMEKLEKDKPELEGLSKGAAMAKDNFDALLKQGGYDEASSIEASKALLEGLYSPAQPQQPAAPQLPPLPPPGTTRVVPSGSPAAIIPTGQWQGVVPLVQQATGGMTPGQMIMAPGQAAGRALTAAAAPGVSEIGQAIASDPGVQGLGRILGPMITAPRYALFGGAPPVWPTEADLSVRSPSAAMRAILDRITQARMRTATGDQAAAQNALAPTAFPVLPPVFTGAP